MRLAVLFVGVLALPLQSQDFPALHEVTGVAVGDPTGNVMAAFLTGAEGPTGQTRLSGCCLLMLA